MLLLLFLFDPLCTCRHIFINNILNKYFITLNLESIEQYDECNCFKFKLIC